MTAAIRIQAIVSVFALLSFGYLAVADPASDTAQQGLLVAPCFECHGMGGVSTEPDVPIIAGQPNFFLIDNLLSFQRRERPCRETRYRAGDTGRPPTSMCDIVAKLSDDDMQIAAEYFAGQEFVSQPQRTSPALVEAGAAVYRAHCARCHTEGGSVVEDDSGILAGQWMPYLRSALDDYRSGTRVALEEKMQYELDQLSEPEVEALVHYFGSLGD